MRATPVAVAVLGAVLALALGFAAHRVAQDTVALPAVDLERSGPLAPPEADDPAAPAVPATTAPTVTTTPRTTTAPPTTTDGRSDNSGSDSSGSTEDNSGSGSDDSGRGRGRGRGRGGNDD